MKTCLYATMRDEGPWVLEWVAHHKVCGFDGIVVATNDCSDGTNAILSRLQDLGHVRTFDNPGPYPSGNIQRAAYAGARQFPELATADWAMPLDADEFLNVRIGDGQVRDLIEHVGSDVDAIAVAWRIFGDSGLTGFPRGSLTDTFTMCDDGSSQNTYVKVLVRDPSRFAVLGEHGPVFPTDDDIPAGFKPRIRTPSRQVIPGKRLFGSKGGRQLNWIMPDKAGWEVAQINHYMVKTRQLYLLRTLRGNAVGDAAQRKRMTWETYDAHNANMVRDTSIGRLSARRQDLMSELLNDTILAELHRDALRLTSEKLAAIESGGSDLPQNRQKSAGFLRQITGRLKGRT